MMLRFIGEIGPLFNWIKCFTLAKVGAQFPNEANKLSHIVTCKFKGKPPINLVQNLHYQNIVNLIPPKIVTLSNLRLPQNIGHIRALFYNSHNFAN